MRCLHHIKALKYHSASFWKLFCKTNIYTLNFHLCSYDSSYHITWDVSITIFLLSLSLSVSQGLDIVMTWEEISCPLLLSLWAWCNVSSYRNYDSWPKSKLQNTSQFSCLITALLQFHASLLLWELNVFCEDVVYGTGFVLLCWQPAEVLGENPKDWDCRATVRRELFFSFWLIHSSVVLLPLIASIKRHLQIWQADPLLGLKLKPILALGAERAHSRRVKLERS